MINCNNLPSLHLNKGSNSILVQHFSISTATSVGRQPAEPTWPATSATASSAHAPGPAPAIDLQAAGPATTRKPSRPNCRWTELAGGSQPEISCTCCTLVLRKGIPSCPGCSAAARLHPKNIHRVFSSLCGYAFHFRSLGPTLVGCLVPVLCSGTGSTDV